MATITYSISRGKTKDIAEIYVRFSASRTFRQRSATKLFVHSNVWDNENGRIRNSQKLSKEDAETKSKLEKLSSYINDRYIADYKNDKLKDDSLKVWIAQIDWIKNSLGNWEIKQVDENSLDYRNMSFSSFFEDFIKKHDVSDTRKKSYFNALKMWQRYEIYSNNTNILIKDITKSNLTEFKQFFNKEHTFFTKDSNDKIEVKNRFAYIYKEYPQSSFKYFIEERSNNYFQDILKKIKTAWNCLMRQGIMIEDIFRDYQIGRAQYAPPVHLTSAERDALYKAENLSAELKIQRDIHIFQSYVGCRYGDLIKLTEANIYSDANSNMRYIHYTPSKTIKAKKEIEPVIVPLHAVCEEIIARYQDAPDKHDKLLPFKTQQYHNRCLKLIYKAVPECNKQVEVYRKGKIELVEMSSVVSSHTGRKNFVGILKEKGFSDEDICSMSGHVEGSTAISRYRVIANPLKEKMIEAL